MLWEKRLRNSSKNSRWWCKRLPLQRYIAVLEYCKTKVSTLLKFVYAMWKYENTYNLNGVRNSYFDIVWIRDVFLLQCC